jgi:hypothetical protein
VRIGRLARRFTAGVCLLWIATLLIGFDSVCRTDQVLELRRLPESGLDAPEDARYDVLYVVAGPERSIEVCAAFDAAAFCYCDSMSLGD